MNLTRLRRRAAWGLWTELLVRAAAPAFGILAAYLAAALFGFGSPWAFLGVLLLTAGALAFGLARLRRPRAEEIDRRIEHVSGLRHRPIAMLEDAPENESQLAVAIWRLHERRIAASLQNARAGWPVVEAEIHDPFALRGLLLLLLLVGGIAAGPAGLPRLGSAFSFPGWPFAGPSVDAWITLPAYTGAPPLVLSPGDAPAVLAGSALTVIVTGLGRPPVAALGRAPIRFSALAQNSFRADAELSASGRLRIGKWWNPLAAWNVTVMLPQPPMVRMSQPLPVDHALLIGWHAQDTYGVASLSATFMPEGHPNAEPEILDLPFNGVNLKDASGVAKPDVGDSPYAGLLVTVTLAARNLAGISGMAASMTVQLPPADFSDKTAIALATLRQRLALDPNTTREQADTLQKLAEAPPSQISAAADLQMAALARQLNAAEISADAAQKRMAMLARQIEQGPDYAPAQALAAANQALEQALRQAITAGKKVDSDRLQQLLAAMHAALARHLQALGAAAAAPGGPEANIGDLDKLAAQIAQDEASGQSAKAAAELNQLQRMLTALQSAKPMSAAQARQEAAANQAAQDLARLTQGESALLDQTNQGAGTPAGQTALQNQLAATRQGLGKAGLSLQGLGDAAAAMDAAHGALEDQNLGAAGAAEGAAIQQLQKAASALASSSQGMSFGESASPSAGDTNYGDGGNGAPDEDSIPGIMPSGENAAGAIQQQIIKNDGDTSLPSAVHQYYHRLLNQDTP